jgi:hypothetical protein
MQASKQPAPSTSRAWLYRNGRVVVVVGDNLGSKKVDGRVAEEILVAAVEAGAKQFVLVNPIGDGIGGGLFGGGGSRTGGLNKLEDTVRPFDWANIAAS